MQQSDFFWMFQKDNKMTEIKDIIPCTNLLLQDYDIHGEFQALFTDSTYRTSKQSLQYAISWTHKVARHKPKGELQSEPSAPQILAQEPALILVASRESPTTQHRNRLLKTHTHAHSGEDNFSKTIQEKTSNGDTRRIRDDGITLRTHRPYATWRNGMRR